MDLKQLSSDLDAIKDSCLIDLGLNDTSSIPDVIYHYTNERGFIGIIKQGEIWLTNANYLNDASEVKYGRRLAAEELELLAGKQETFVFPDRTNLPPNVIAGPYPDKMGMLKRSFLSNAAYHVANTLYFDHYVASFCLDDNLLSQWRAYGVQGGGFSLGIHVPKQTFRRCDDVIDEVLLSCFPIIYKPEQQKTALKSYIDKVFASFEKCLPMMDRQKLNEGSDPIYIEHKNKMINGLVEIGLCFKDPGFEVEKEYRVMASLPYGDTLHLDFREGGGHLIPYIALKLKDDDDPVTLRSVTCGPGPNSDISQVSAKLFLNKYTHPNVPVNKSEIPLKG